MQKYAHMTYYLIISLCVIILTSYFFDVTAKYTRIPGVILMIIMGMVIHEGQAWLNVSIPDLSGLLPMMGTLGLILIVLEGSLDLSLQSSRKATINASVSSAIVLLLIFMVLSALVLTLMGYSLQSALICMIPLAIVSSAVAIPAAQELHKGDKDFVVYESSVSDIAGILAFNFILNDFSRVGQGLMGLLGDLIITLFISVLLSALLALLLHKITHHVKYVIITTAIIGAYALAMLQHMPSLLMVLVFGLVMNNNHLFKNRYTTRYIDFDNFSHDLSAFKQVTGELTFVVRSFFFIMFGFYTDIADLIDLKSLAIAAGISALLILLRGLYLKYVLKRPLNPLLFFSPKGLITILLFLAIPDSQLLPFMTRGLITQVIFISILWMSFGNILLGFRKKAVIV